MNINEMISEYGRGDNSVTDRMWYELALNTCIGLDELYSTEGKLGYHLMAYAIAKANGKDKDAISLYENDATRIVNRLVSGGTAFTSRISVEYVRQQIEKLVNQNS